MGNHMANKSSPVGFWRFVVVSSVVIGILRQLMFGSGLKSDFTSLFWFSASLWVAYRVARLQPWWPFRDISEASGESEYRQVQMPVSNQESAPREARLRNPLTAEDLRRDFKRQAAKAARKVLKKVAPIYTPPEPAMAMAGGFDVASRMSPRLPSGPVSSVGVRSKTVRSKVARRKTVRTKRR